MLSSDFSYTTEQYEYDRAIAESSVIVRRAKDIASLLPQMDNVSPDNLALVSCHWGEYGWVVIFQVDILDNRRFRVSYDRKLERTFATPFPRRKS
jgi:hypothetical protein